MSRFRLTALLLMMMMRLCDWIQLRGIAAPAQPDPGFGYRVDRWTSESGLPQNSARALCQTRDGYLWIGTLYGLARFDGLRFAVFDHGNTPEMPSDSINDLAEDPQDGSLWIATSDALLRYHDHRFERFGSEEGIDSYPGRLWPAARGGVWFQWSHEGVGLVRDGRVKKWNIEGIPTGDAVSVLIDSGSFDLLVLFGRGLHRFDLISGALERVGPPDEAAASHALCPAQDGSLLVSTSKGLWRWQKSVWTLLDRSYVGTILETRPRSPANGPKVWSVGSDGWPMDDGSRLPTQIFQRPQPFIGCWKIARGASG